MGILGIHHWQNELCIPFVTEAIYYDPMRGECSPKAFNWDFSLGYHYGHGFVYH